MAQLRKTGGLEKGHKKGLETGLELGLEKGKTIFIRGLLEQTDFTVDKIAEIGDVPVLFVEMVKASLSKQ